MLTTDDPGEIRYRNTMDELNHMMKVRKIDSEVQKRVRMFFMQARGTHEGNAQRNLLQQMSPMLRAEIAGLTYGRIVRNVWYFHEASDEFTAEVATHLETCVFVKGEKVFIQGKLCVVKSGLCARNGNIPRAGRCWGEDFVLSDQLRKVSSVLALTFLEVQTFSPEIFYDILLEADVEDYESIRKKIVKFIFIRGIIHAAEEERRSQGLKLRSAGFAATTEKTHSEVQEMKRKRMSSVAASNARIG